MAENLLINKAPYYLPLTRVRVHGTRTLKTPVGGTKSGTSEVQVDLVSTADPRHPRYIVEADSLLADRLLTVEWSEKGLLTGTNAVSTGKLGQIVQNVFGAVLRLSLFMGAMAAGPMAAAPAAGSSAEELYEQQFPDLSAARKAAKKAVSDLLKTIAEVAKDLAAEADVEKLKEKRVRLNELIAALTDLKKEAEALETHFNSWKAGQEKVEVTPRDSIVDLDDLPREDDVRALQGKTADQIKQVLPAAVRDLFWDLGVIVADLRRWPDPVSQFPPNDGESPVEPRRDARGVEFRLPRPTLMSLFEIRQDAEAATFSTVLKERRETCVIDDRCATAILRIKGGIWSNKSLDIDFSASGAPTKVTTDAKSELAAVADALSKLPGEALQSLKDANGFIDERQKLALQGVEQRIDELKKEKEVALGRIALNETLATEQQAAELKRLDQEISLLQKQVQFKQLSGTEASDVQVKLVQVEGELVKARTALDSAKIERLKIQAALKKAQPPEGDPK